MKRSIFILLLILVLLTGCTVENPLPNPDGDGAAQTAADAVAAIIPERVCGTYLGLGGAALVVRADGTADYYEGYLPEPMNNCACRVIDNNVCVDLVAPYEHPVFAKLPESGAVTSLLLQSDSDEWHEEYYVKVSNDMKPRTAAEFRSLIEEKGNRSLTFSLTIGDMELWIPLYYTLAERDTDLEESRYSYVFTDKSFADSNGESGAYLMIFCQAAPNLGYTDANAAQKLEETLENELLGGDSEETVVSLTKEDKDGVVVRKKVVTAKAEGREHDLTAYVAYDGAGVYLFELMQTPAGEGKYIGDFEAMVDQSLTWRSEAIG